MAAVVRVVDAVWLVNNWGVIDVTMMLFIIDYEILLLKKGR